MERFTICLKGRVVLHVLLRYFSLFLSSFLKLTFFAVLQLLLSFIFLFLNHSGLIVESVSVPFLAGHGLVCVVVVVSEFAVSLWGSCLAHTGLILLDPSDG